MNTIKFIFSSDGYWVWSIIEAAAITLTLMFVILQLKVTNNGNLLSMLSVFRSEWQSENMQKAKAILCSGYLKRELTIGPDEEQVLGFFEQIGLMYKHKLLNGKMVWDLYSFDINLYWLLSKDKINTIRKCQNNDTSFYADFQSVYTLCNRISKKKKRYYEYKTEEIEELAKMELNRIKKTNEYKKPRVNMVEVV